MQYISLVICTLSVLSIINSVQSLQIKENIVNNYESTGKSDECLVCNPFSCPDVKNCNAGVVRDRCGCCDVCAIEEGHLCNINSYEPGKTLLDEGGIRDIPSDREVWYGHCGVDLECRERKDVDKEMSGKQSICYCIKPGLVCGSDGKTYSWCKMHELEVATKNKTSMISVGPCKSEPKIIFMDDSQVVPKKSRISILCEVEGYPTPTIIWYYTNPSTKEETRLPGDNEEINVSFRGGPQPMRISSHLQVTNFGEEHEGKYRCVADNDMGIRFKTISLVTGPEEK